MKDEVSDDREYRKDCGCEYKWCRCDITHVCTDEDGRCQCKFSTFEEFYDAQDKLFQMPKTPVYDPNYLENLYEEPAKKRGLIKVGENIHSLMERTKKLEEYMRSPEDVVIVQRDLRIIGWLALWIAIAALVLSIWY
jgi:hypothetical protein